MRSSTRPARHPRRSTTSAALGTDAAATLDSYLADNGWRMVTTYDPSGLAFTGPALLLQRIVAPARSGIDPSSPPRQPPNCAAEVPADEREEFDNLLAEVKVTCELRDDNGQFTAAWPVGLLRRALLECARRLSSSGALADPAHVMDLEIDETVTLLAGATTPSAADAADGPSSAPRTTTRATGAPRYARTRTAIRAVAGRHRDIRPRRSRPSKAWGPNRPPSTARCSAPVSEARPTSVARVVAHQPEEAIERLEPGDVLVAFFTTPAYNAVLPLTGALVVETGGFLSHAAVMARELELPAVVGAAGAMATINDGDIVEVDPVADQYALCQRIGKWIRR